MVWDWRVSRAGPMPFYWPSCSLPFCLLLFSLSLLSFYGLVLWGWCLRTDRVWIALSPGLALPTFFNNNNNNNNSHTRSNCWRYKQEVSISKFQYNNCCQLLSCILVTCASLGTRVFSWICLEDYVNIALWSLCLSWCSAQLTCSRRLTNWWVLYPTQFDVAVGSPDNTVL